MIETNLVGTRVIFNGNAMGSDRDTVGIIRAVYLTKATQTYPKPAFLIATDDGRLWEREFTDVRILFDVA